jgi:hypothetical protein
LAQLLPALLLDRKEVESRREIDRVVPESDLRRKQRQHFWLVVVGDKTFGFRRKSLPRDLRHHHHQQAEEQFLSNESLLVGGLHRLPVQPDPSNDLRATDRTLQRRRRTQQSDRGDDGVRFHLHHLLQHPARHPSPERVAGRAEEEGHGAVRKRVEAGADSREDLHPVGVLSSRAGPHRRGLQQPPQSAGRIRNHLPERPLQEDVDLCARVQTLLRLLRVPQDTDQTPGSLGHGVRQQLVRMSVAYVRPLHGR